MLKIPFTRREIALLLFCVTIFTIFYNLDNSQPHVFVSQKSNNVNKADIKIPADSLLSIPNAFREDGRRTEEYVDDLEVKILGNWEPDGRPIYDLGVAGAPAGQTRISWNDAAEVPKTNLLAHVSGLTIMENVYFFKGVIYIVRGGTSSFPSPEAISSSTGIPGSNSFGAQEVRVISVHEAQETMGDWAMKMRGSTWICTGSKIFGEGHSLLALYRAYSTVSKGTGPLTPPDRVFFTHIKAEDWSTTGFDIRLSRLLFPFMQAFFVEDWKDLADIDRPYYFEQVIIADQTAALTQASELITASSEGTDVNHKAAMSVSVQDEQLTISKAFVLPVYPNWFTSIRDILLHSLSISHASRAKAITYISTQRRASGPRLDQSDHAQLVSELLKLGDANDWDVHIIELADEAAKETSWRQQITAALQSSITLAVNGNFLGYAVFMKPTLPTPTIIEFFPRNVFSNNNEFVARAMGMDYIAWQDTRKYAAPSLPPVTATADDEMHVINLDVNAIIRTIKEQMKR